MFYFHGKSNEDFCLVSDTNLHVNAHFIGIRPEGRTRDFTWVQALGVMFDNHSFSVGAKTVAQWTDHEDHMMFTYDGQDIVLDIGAGNKWSSDMGEVEIVRTSETNVVQVKTSVCVQVLTPHFTRVTFLPFINMSYSSIVCGRGRNAQLILCILVFTPQIPLDKHCTTDKFASFFFTRKFP